MTPTVSVVIPSYNCAAYVPTAIESVLAQTYGDLEIIVVDDGSTDATPDVVQPFVTQIRYIRQPNQGLPGARNAGIRAAKGQFIALLDADDSWSPEKLALQMPRFADPEVGIVYSDFRVQYSDGRVLDSYLANRPLACEGFVADRYIRSRFMFPSTMVFRRAAFDQCGLFDVNMLAAEDMELFTRMCLHWKVARVDGVLMTRAEGTHNITANPERMATYTIKALRAVLQREPKMPHSTRRTLRQELGRQYSWRAYELFKRRRRSEAVRAMLLGMRFDRATWRANAPLLLASLLPYSLLNRLRPGLLS